MIITSISIKRLVPRRLKSKHPTVPPRILLLKLRVMITIKTMQMNKFMTMGIKQRLSKWITTIILIRRMRLRVTMTILIATHIKSKITKVTKRIMLTLKGNLVSTKATATLHLRIRIHTSPLLKHKYRTLGINPSNIHKTTHHKSFNLRRILNRSILHNRTFSALLMHLRASQGLNNSNKSLLLLTKQPLHTLSNSHHSQVLIITCKQTQCKQTSPKKML
jgi:hypothetical protein